MHKLSTILHTNGLAMKDLFLIWLAIFGVFVLITYIITIYKDYKFNQYVKHIRSKNAYVGKRDKTNLRLM